MEVRQPNIRASVARVYPIKPPRQYNLYSVASLSLTLKNNSMKKIEKLDDNVNMLSTGNDIVDILFWLGSFRVKINELIDAINTLTAPKPHQEESKGFEHADLRDEDMIRADERKKLYKALLERDSKMYKYYKSGYEGGYPAEWDEPFTY